MNCIIVDDEPLAHQVLEHYIAETPGIIHIASFRNAVEAFEYLAHHKIDLLFLDIEMPLVNGIHFLKALENSPKTIFTTAYKQYAYEGYELDAVDYLLKPFSYERFVKAIRKAVPAAGNLSENKNSHLLIKDKDGLLHLKQQDIIYIEGSKDHVRIFTAENSYLVYRTLKGILEDLNTAFFFQAHRSYLVNKNYISRIAKDQLILTNQFFIPIGPLYKKYLLEQLNS